MASISCIIKVKLDACQFCINSILKHSSTKAIHYFIAGQNLLPTERQYSDGFAQLAAHLMLDVNSDKGITFVLL